MRNLQETRCAYVHQPRGDSSIVLVSTDDRPFWGTFFGNFGSLMGGFSEKIKNSRTFVANSQNSRTFVAISPQPFLLDLHLHFEFTCRYCCCFVGLIYQS